MHAFATLLIIIGVVLVVVFSNHGDRNYDVAQLRGRFVKKPFLVLCATVSSLSLAFYGTAKQGIEGLGPLSCAFLSSVCGSFSVLLTKCSAQLIKECTLETPSLPETNDVRHSRWNRGAGNRLSLFSQHCIKLQGECPLCHPSLLCDDPVWTGQHWVSLFWRLCRSVHRARLPHLRRTGALRRWRRNAWVEAVANDPLAELGEEIDAFVDFDDTLSEEDAEESEDGLRYRREECRHAFNALLATRRLEGEFARLRAKAFAGMPCLSRELSRTRQQWTRCQCICC